MIMAEPAERQATYEDLLRVSAHFVAEIINGRLVTHPRPAPRHLQASSSLGVELNGPSTRAVAGQGDGGSWTSPSCISGPIFWSRILRAGVGRACRAYRKLPGSSWPRIGSVKSCPLERPRTIVPRSCRSVRNTAWCTPGSSIPNCVPWRPSRITRESGTCSPP